MATEKKLQRKAEKAKAQRAERIEMLLWRIGIAAVVVAFFVGVGVTFVNMYKNYQDSKPNYNSTEMVVGDITGVLQATEADEQAVSEEGQAADEIVVEGDESADSEAAIEGETLAENADEVIEGAADEGAVETEGGVDEGAAEAVGAADAVDEAEGAE